MLLNNRRVQSVETFRSYGAVGTRREGEIIRDLAKPQQTDRPNIAEIAKR
jgi:hypothetical protein